LQISFQAGHRAQLSASLDRDDADRSRKHHSINETDFDWRDGAALSRMNEGSQLVDAFATAPFADAPAGLVVGQTIDSHAPFQGAPRIDLRGFSFHIDHEPEMSRFPAFA
jgi:hypothetical protein